MTDLVVLTRVLGTVLDPVLAYSLGDTGSDSPGHYY